MSDLGNLLTPKGVVVNAQANCKREALSLLAEKSGELAGIASEKILSVLQEREKLGSTGVGGGIAIPHGKVKGINDMLGVLALLKKPVDFDAVDDEPVDLLFLLLAPEEANAMHLKTLSRVARLMRNDEVRAAMRGASSSDALYAIAMERERSRAA
ncbi:PTS sugar transporter subunit IIA [Parvularcula sp. IMCC14364]|uniref:PTS sugar transporter subunit IIA n=1 Tax=Parvularcula sp. IMCC14364 TaxID=3067902 RepID=UPI0027429658|nr:PTS sugar transporter subunit IIA [Parvularcula sp. IMCC14364]